MRCLELLLSADASVVNSRVKDEGTAVHIACEKGHAGSLRLLLRHGANVEAHVAPSDDPRTPLHLAAEYAHEECVVSGCLPWKNTMVAVLLSRPSSPTSHLPLHSTTTPARNKSP